MTMTMTVVPLEDYSLFSFLSNNKCLAGSRAFILFESLSTLPLTKESVYTFSPIYYIPHDWREDRFFADPSEKPKRSPIPVQHVLLNK